MTRIQRVLRALDEVSPLAIAQSSWDNVGLLIEAQEPKTYPARPKLVVTIDLTTAVMTEVEQLGNVHFIVAYHPPLFNKIRRITTENVKSSIAIRCISQNISVYSPHTALDNCAGGINSWLAATFDGISRPLDVIQDPIVGQEGIGYGQIVTLTQATPVDSIVSQIKKRLNLEHVRLARGFQESVSTIAICAGSGASLLMKDDKPRADLLFTGEMSHHEVLSCVENGASVVLCEHTNTERPYLTEYCKMLQVKLPDWDIVQSRVDSDPLQIV